MRTGATCPCLIGTDGKIQHQSGCGWHSPPSYFGVNSPPAPAGWVCPVCGSGVAPHVDMCPCTTYTVALDFLGGTKSIDPDISEAVDAHFWELLA